MTREDAIKWIIDHHNPETLAGTQDSQAHMLAIEALRQPEVIRCKDCRYWQDNNDGYPNDECRWGHEETPDPDDFCSFAERMDCETFLRENEPFMFEWKDGER